MSLPTWGAWIEIEVENREPSAEVSAATRRTQDSDGNEKTAREGGTKASIDQYSYQGKSMTENSEIYSYDFLTHQPDMKVVELPPMKMGFVDFKAARKDAVRERFENLKANGATVDEVKAVIKNRYSGRQILVTKSALVHSIDGNKQRIKTNALLSSAAGGIVKNAIPINAIKNDKEGPTGTYAMIAVAKAGEKYVAAVMTVEQYTDNVLSIYGQDLQDQLHAMSGRIDKKGGSLSSKWNQGYLENEAPNSATSMLSIADVIRIVNTTYQSILSDDVLKALGEERNSEGYYAQRARFPLGQQTDEKYNLGRSPDGKRELKSWRF